MALLIDDRGLVWPSTAAVISRRSGGMRRWPDFVRQAVALGFIHVKFGVTGTQIALHPAFITRKSVSGLANTAHANASERIAVSYDGQASSWELIQGKKRAIAFIEALRARTQSAAPKALLMTRPCELDLVGSVERGRLAPALGAWTESPVRSTAELYELLQRLQLLDHSVVFRRSRGSDRFLIEHWGTRRNLFGPTWTRIARGRDLLDQPNKYLGEWNAAAAATVAEAERPVLLACDFVLATPQARLVRRTDKRLILPWKGREQDILMVNLHGGQRTTVLIT